jgi:hypothetical protein
LYNAGRIEADPEVVVGSFLHYADGCAYILSEEGDITKKDDLVAHLFRMAQTIALGGEKQKIVLIAIKRFPP